MSSARTLPPAPTDGAAGNLQKPVARRTVVAAAAWSVPAISIASATPAFANTSHASNMTIAGPASGVPASGAVPMTVTVKDAQGQPQAGQPVSFSGPDGSSFDAADGVTNGAGQYTANFNLNKPWAKPGGTISVTAVSGSGNTSQSFAVLGANVLGWGSGTFGVTGLGNVNNTSTPSQLMQVFPSPVVQISQGGDYFTLFRLADGTVWGVGRNGQGQLADGTTNDVYWPPQRVPGLSNVVDVAAGYQTAYAVLQDGSVRSWGVNAYSALGDGTTYSAKGYSTSVVTVQGVSGAVKVAGGSWFGLALLSNGTVAGWGRNGFGQLGDTTNGDRATATTASGVSNVTDIAATSVAGYALRSDGTIMAWGGNWKGQQGDGSTTSGNRYTPAAVSGISTATSIAASGEAGYALLADKTVVAWGNGENGELGNGASAASPTPVAVQGLTDAVQIGAGYALTESGAVYAWGPNDSGQLGDGNNGSGSNVPVAVALPAGTPVQAIGGSAGANARYAITGELTVNVDVVDNQISAGSAGTVQAKVSSGSAGVSGAEVSLTATNNAVLGSTLGQTNGNGDLVTTVTPDQWTMPGTQVTVRASTDAAVSADTFTALGANALACGWGQWGALGLDRPRYGWPTVWSTPTQVWPIFSSRIVKIVSNNNSTSIALLADGTVWGIGNNGYYTVTGSTDQALQDWVQVAGVSNVKDVAIGDYCTTVLLSDGTLMTWGTNHYGIMGDPALADGQEVKTPHAIPNISGVQQVVADRAAIFIRMTDGTIRAAGFNGNHSIGDGTTNSAPSFVQVQGVAGAADIHPYMWGAAVLRSDKTVVHWGGSQTTAAQVTNLSGVSSISGGLALMPDGTVKQFGTGAATTTVPNVTGARMVSANGTSFYVQQADGSIIAWGKNDGGQLGDGTQTDRSTPVTMTGLEGRVVTWMAANPAGQRVALITADSSVSVDIADGQVTAGVASAVLAKVAAGSSAVAGATVALTATDNAALGASSGTTNASGVFQTTVTPDLWTAPGEVVRVTASSGASSAQDTFQTIGANVAGQGAGFGGDNQAVILTDRVFPSPIVQIASACGDSAGDTWWMALLADGTVWTRGYDNPFNQMAGGGSGDSTLKWGKVPSLSNVKQIAIMYGSGFALLESGKVMAWGANWQGQLGIGSTNVPSSPVEIPNLSNVAAITVGDRTGYALLTDGTVKAWGQNDSGEVGNGTFTNPVLSPESVSNLTNVRQLAATRHTGVALRSDGTVWSWGNNSTATPASNNSAWGLVGDGSSQNQATPVKLTSLSGVTQISGGGQAAYAVLSDKTVMAWGTNADGAVGDGTATNRTTPVAISGLSNVVKVSGLDANGYALLADGTVKAWGQNNWGQLCDGSTTNRLSPVTATSAMNGHPVTDLPVRSPRGVYSGFFVYGTASVSVEVATSVAAGSTSAVTAKVMAGPRPVAGAALTLAASGGAVLATTSGQSDASGQLQTTVTPDAWTQPGTSLSVTASSGSSSATDRYVVLGANALACGWGQWGALGLDRPKYGWPTTLATPTQVWPIFSSPIVKIVSNNNSTSIALLADGSVWGIGNNGYYTVTGATDQPLQNWIQVPGVSNVRDVAIGDYCTTALLADGTLVTWGTNHYGIMGDPSLSEGQEVKSPRPLPNISGVQQVIADRAAIFIRMQDGTVRAAGFNGNHSIGDGTTTSSPSFKPVSGVSNVVDMHPYMWGAAVLRNDQTVWHWGGPQTTAVQVSGLSGVASISGGLALMPDGTVKTFGTGAATATVPNISGARMVSSNGTQFYVQRSDGSMLAWGKNDGGQLGDGTQTDRSTPVAMTALAGRTVTWLAANPAAQRVAIVTA
ncbi:Alpha-tubulin suppressor [Microbacterium hydrothermale]|uniref:Ig-like domain-containing protein n=1 Tax=Microbacterium hydrothermale TaxID=857427 RepID=UPI002227EA1E|nr:Ig-like domain-containing protein [Microbacterium hydrothermale]MCW2163983.1 Alpha-tubulin suppressor [Microbacterium hydrothermale]